MSSDLALKEGAGVGRERERDSVSRLHHACDDRVWRLSLVVLTYLHCCAEYLLPNVLQHVCPPMVSALLKIRRHGQAPRSRAGLKQETPKSAPTISAILISRHPLCHWAVTALTRLARRHPASPPPKWCRIDTCGPCYLHDPF